MTVLITLVTGTTATGVSVVLDVVVDDVEDLVVELCRSTMSVSVKCCDPFYQDSMMHVRGGLSCKHDEMCHSYSSRRASNVGD